MFSAIADGIDEVVSGGLVRAVSGDIEEAIAALRKAKERAPEDEDRKVDEFLASLLKASAEAPLR